MQPPYPVILVTARLWELNLFIVDILASLVTEIFWLFCCHRLVPRPAFYRLTSRVGTQVGLLCIGCRGWPIIRVRIRVCIIGIQLHMKSTQQSDVFKYVELRIGVGVAVVVAQWVMLWIYTPVTWIGYFAEQYAVLFENG